MSTASDQAPAAQGSLERGADNQVRARRIEQGLSRVQLAARVEVSKSRIAGIENGHHRPSLELAQRIAEALDSDVAELFRLCTCDCGCCELMVDQDRLGSSARFLPGHNCRGPEHATAATRAHRARRARLGIPEEKTCKVCGDTFTRSEFPNQPLVHWLAREHCSFDCSHGPPIESTTCAICGKPFKPAYREGRCCCASHGQRFRFEAGNVAEAFVEQMPGRGRQKWGGRWNATKPPAPGAQPRGRPTVELTDEKRRRIKLASRRWGRRRIASEFGLSERTVRNVLDA